MIRAVAILLCLFALGPLCGGPGRGSAAAQMIDLTPPPDAAPDRRGADSGMLPRDHGRTPPVGPDPSVVPAPAEDLIAPLRPIRPEPMTDGTIRLQGETAAARLAVFVPGNGQSAPVLRLAHRTGIDALPARSELRVLLNGTAIARIPTDNFDGFGGTEITLPGDLLIAGRNIVTVQAAHTHRVFCGPEASFDLWTEIDMRQSGVVIPEGLFPVSAGGFMAALAAHAAQGVPVPVASAPDFPVIDRFSDGLADIVRALGSVPPVFVTTSHWRMARPEDRGRITVLSDAAPMRDLPRFERGGDGAVVLLLGPETPRDAIAEILTAGMGMRVDPRPPLLTPGRPVPMTALGRDGIAISGRHAQVGVSFRLPPDWLLLATQKARIDLDYRFAPDLPEGALLVITVNDTAVRLLPLDRRADNAPPTLPVAFGANLLHPGVNRIAFETIIPGATPDSACPVQEGPFVEIAPRSAVMVPASPRMIRPDLNAALERIRPGGVQISESGARVLPSGLGPLIAAGFSHAEDGPRGGELLLGTVSDLERLRNSSIADSLAELERALLAPQDPTGADGDAAAAAPDAPDPRPVWIRLPAVSSIFDGGTATLGRLAGLGSPTLTTWLADRRAEALLLQPDPADPDRIMLLMRPTLDPMRMALAIADARDGQSGVHGQVALLGTDGRWSSWVDPDRPLLLLEPVTAGNLRAVLGNFATHRPLRFVGVFLALTLVSAGVAMAILFVTRRY